MKTARNVGSHWGLSLLLLLPASAWAAEPQKTSDSITPPDGAINAPGTTNLQKVLVAPLDGDTRVNTGGWRLDAAVAGQGSVELKPKIGRTGLQLGGTAQVPGAKGDFAVGSGIPASKLKMIGCWVYVTPDANIASAGLQFYDAEGEVLIGTIEIKGAGWQWIEFDLTGADVHPAYEQKDKNGTLDAPIKGIHLVWFSKAAGPASITFNALVAAVEPSPDADGVTVDAGAGAETVIEPGQSLTSMIVLNNFNAKPVTAKVSFVVQEDPHLFDGAAPDPVYGSDHALGAKSWTLADGKMIEEGSLTDGDDSTNAGTVWNGQWLEAFQYVDLGKERRVTRLGYLAGDANWAWKVDISASPDGKTFKPVEGLQGIDIHQKWGHQSIPVAMPFAARVVQLRYHHDGEKCDVLRMFSALSIYDGIDDEKFEIPSTGRVIAKGEQTISVPPRSFASANVGVEKPLARGSYLVVAKIEHEGRTQMSFRHCFVMPTALAPAPTSRFGLNASQPSLAPMLGRLGIGWVRFENMKWPMASPKANDFRFDGTVGPWNVNHDAIMDAYRAQGISILPFLFQTASYASSAPPAVKEDRRWAYPPTDNAAFGEFCFQTVARYGAAKHPADHLKTPDHMSGTKKISTFEIWNEQNLTDPGWGPWVSTSPRYFEMFRAAAEAVKRADPTARVANGGIAGIEVATVDEWQSYKYADGKSPLDFVDVLSVHYYSGREVPELAVIDTNVHRDGDKGSEKIAYEENLKQLVAWRDKYKKGMPIWLTETGYDTGGPAGITERLQAARLPRCVMMALAAGIEKVIVYREQGSTPTFHACEGVIRDDGSLKPSYFTYGTLIRQLDGMTSGQRIDYPADKNVRVYRWETGRGPVISCWAVQGSAKVKLAVGTCEQTDSFGQTSSILTDEIPLTDFPIYLSKFEDMKKIKALK